MEHVAPGYTPMSAHPKVQPPTNVREQYFAGSSGREGASAIALHNGKTNGLGSSGFYSSSDEAIATATAIRVVTRVARIRMIRMNQTMNRDDDSDDSSDESDEADSSDESDSD